MRYGIFSSALALLTATTLIACSGGGSTSGGESDYEEQTFVASEDTTGRLELTVDSNELPVGGSTGFLVRVLNARNEPVPNLRIGCDTEEGLALIEPVLGSSLSNGNGVVSGIVGCSQPGSYQIGCRLPVGGNRRQFVGIRCTGEIPVGFGGFPGAAGGGLGGGALPPESGGPGGSGTGRVRIVGLDLDTISSEDDEFSPQVDLNFGLCGTAAPFTPEPFGDDYIEITVVNDSDLPVRFREFRYVVEQGLATGEDAESPILSLTQEAEAKPGERVTFSSLAFRAFVDASNSSNVRSGKQFGSPSLEASEGFKSVRVELLGRNSAGESVRARSSFTVNFGNFNVCESS